MTIKGFIVELNWNDLEFLKPLRIDNFSFLCSTYCINLEHKIENYNIVNIILFLFVWKSNANLKHFFNHNKKNNQSGKFLTKLITKNNLYKSYGK